MEEIMIPEKVKEPRRYPLGVERGLRLPESQFAEWMRNGAKQFGWATCGGVKAAIVHHEGDNGAGFETNIAVDSKKHVYLVQVERIDNQ